MTAPSQASKILDASRLVDGAQSDAAWLRRCIQALDLTTLEATDNDDTVRALCQDAIRAKVAAVCVYGRFVPVALEELIDDNIAVAAVAMGFPHGQSSLAARLTEVESAVRDGATEIDMVIQRGEALRGNWASVEREIRAARSAAPHATLKVILGTGELADDGVIYRAARVAIDAGADFLKTSTGKIAVGATPQAAAAILHAIADSGTNTGFKAAGGVRTPQAALFYALLMREYFGDDALAPTRFRLGGSSLLAALERALETLELEQQIR